MSDGDSVITVDELNEMEGKGAGDKAAPSAEQGSNSAPSPQSGYAARPGGSGYMERSHGQGYGHGPPGYGQRQMYPADQNSGRFATELCSKVLFIQSRKFYIDVKESKRGRFVKISEVAQGAPMGQKSRMTMEMKSAIELHDKLTEFIEHYASLGPKPKTAGPRHSRILSETIFAAERRYYLDLMETSRGRILKIAMIMPPPLFERAEILIPAQGMIDLRDVLTDLINEFGKNTPGGGASVGGAAANGGASSGRGAVIKTEGTSEEAGGGGMMPTDASATEAAQKKEEEAKLTLRAGGKSFQFVVGDNRRGQHLRISEFSPTFRTAISVPREIWIPFLDLLRTNTGLAGKQNTEGGAAGEGAGEGAGAGGLSEELGDAGDSYMVVEDDVVWSEGGPTLIDPQEA